jgi:acyl phosphate:glycerol-3-phosphate acyltransferase
VLGLAYVIGAFPIQWLKKKRRIYPILLFVFLDLCKGIFATLIGWWLGGMVVAHLAAIVVVVGEIYPIFTWFRGGNGVGVAAGALAVLSPILILVGLVVYILSLLITRYLFLSTFLSTLAVIIFSLILVTHFYVWVVIFCLGCLVLNRHRVHWHRFRRGVEPPVQLHALFRRRR